MTNLRPAFDEQAPPNARVFGLAQAWNKTLNRSNMIQQDFNRLTRERIWSNCVNCITFVGGGGYGLWTACRDILSGNYLSIILPIIVSSAMIYFGRHAVGVLRADMMLSQTNKKYGYQVAQQMIERTYNYHRQAVTPHWK